jgi:hypothetical protein
MPYDLPRWGRRRIGKKMANPVPNLGYDRMDWDYLGLYAMYRITCERIEFYIRAQSEENMLGPHNPKGNILELEHQKHVLDVRLRQMRMQFAVLGRKAPDYDAYKRAYKEMKYEHTNEV